MGKERPTTKQIAEAITRRAGNEELTRILNDRKERLLTGALGTEFLYRVFRPTLPPPR